MTNGLDRVDIPGSEMSLDRCASQIHLPEFRVLLVDGNPVDRACFAERLRACAPEAELAVNESIAGARQWLVGRADAADLILLDLDLLGPHGAEFVHWLRHCPGFSHILVIAITRDVTFACAAPSDYGVHALLVKPIADEDLAAVLVLVRAGCRSGGRRDAVTRWPVQ